MPSKKLPQNPWPEVLKLLRERTGWTQAQAAEEIGATVRSWRRWESTKPEASQTPVGPIAFALKCLVKSYLPELVEKLPK